MGTVGNCCETIKPFVANLKNKIVAIESFSLAHIDFEECFVKGKYVLA